LACHGQLGEDGRHCQICGDIEHQAPFCEHNAFIMWEEAGL